ncbi:MAG: hypothetical protein NTW25_07310 [Candidatus Kapabacteria bacterium]|jgi:hypothetical protein|nr:hypothetical protein [Candidatus Kapabacteria bacterium]
MRMKTLFSTENWQTLQFAVMWVFQNVAGADGNVDRKEQQALKTVTSNSAKFKDPLIKELLLSLDVNPGLVFRQSMTDVRGFQQGLKETAKIVDKALEPKDSIYFKKTLIAIGFYIANISGEINSEMSDEEATILANLAFLLNLNVDELAASPSIEDIIANL